MSIITHEKPYNHPLSAPSMDGDQWNNNDKKNSKVNLLKKENHQFCYASEMAGNIGPKRNSCDLIKSESDSQSDSEPSEGPTVVVTSEGNSSDEASSLEDVSISEASVKAKMKSELSVSSPDLSFFFDPSPVTKKQSRQNEASSPIEDVEESKILSTSSPLSSISESDVPDWFAPSPELTKIKDSPDWFSPTPKRANSDSNGQKKKKNTSDQRPQYSTTTTTTFEKSNGVGEEKPPTGLNGKNEEPLSVECVPSYNGNRTPSMHHAFKDYDGSVQRRRQLQSSIQHHHHYHHHHQHHHHHHYHHQASSHPCVRTITTDSISHSLSRDSSAANRNQKLKNELGTILEAGDESNGGLVDVAATATATANTNTNTKTTPPTTTTNIATARTSFKQPAVRGSKPIKSESKHDSISSTIRGVGDPRERDDDISRHGSDTHVTKQVISPVFRSKNFSRLGRKKNEKKRSKAKKKTTSRRSQHSRSRGKRSHKVAAPVRVRKKRVAKKQQQQWFLDDEVQISQDSNVVQSSDEGEDLRDSYESSFIDDISQDNSGKMAPIYLNSIIDTALKRGYDMSRTGRHIPKRDIVSQVSLGENSEYELDSFCVGSDRSNMESIDEESEKEELIRGLDQRDEGDDDLSQIVHQSEAQQSRRPIRKRIIPLEVSSAE